MTPANSALVGIPLPRNRHYISSILIIRALSTPTLFFNIETRSIYYLGLCLHGNCDCKDD